MGRLEPHQRTFQKQEVLDMMVSLPIIEVERKGEMGKKETKACCEGGCASVGLCLPISEVLENCLGLCPEDLTL